MPNKPKLSIIIPIYNEELILLDALTSLSEHFDKTVGENNWQFVLVDNGSQDQTPKLLNRISNQWDNTLNIRLDDPNLGLALRTGLEMAKTPWALIFMVDEWDIPFLCWSWSNRESHDYFVGSKMSDPTLNHQTWFRRFLTWGLNAILELFAYHVGTDTHGPKLIRLDAVRPHIEKCKIEKGQFDTEMTLRTVRAGMRVMEVPVIYKERRSSRNWMTVKIFRNIRDVIRLSLIMRDIPFVGNLRFRRIAREDVMVEYAKLYGQNHDLSLTELPSSSASANK